MRIAVIGAGCSGITAVKACLEEGLDVVCFEKASNSGGLWWYRDEGPQPGTGTVMRFTVCNTSKEMSSFSDFPPDKDAPWFMTHWQTLRYIRAYADHFGVTPKIHFNHEVLWVGKDGTVKVRDLCTTREWEDVFDGVLICTGHHASPLEPDIPGRELYRRRIMHSRDYKYADDTFKDKTVVVVGFGNSALDIAVNLSTVTRQVFLSARRINWILPLLYKSVPTDVYLFNQARLWLYSFLPQSCLSRLLMKVGNDIWDHEALRLVPDRDVSTQRRVVNQYIQGKIIDGTVKVRGPPQRFTEKGIVVDNVEEEADCVIFATGFTTDLPFPTDVLSQQGERFLLYNMMIPPESPNVAFLGFAYNNGSFMPVFEMQARYMARVFSGKLTLPSKEDMDKWVAARQRKLINTPRHYLSIDKTSYIEDLAKAIRVKPNYAKIFFTDPKLYYTLVTSPVLNYQYRLQGPHSWHGARDAILGYQERMGASLHPHRNSANDAQNRAAHFETSKVIVLCAIVGVSAFLGFWKLKTSWYSIPVVWRWRAERLLVYASLTNLLL